MTEELFQQYLEGEYEPKKRKKVGEDLKKKKGSSDKKADDELKDDGGDDTNPIEDTIVGGDLDEKEENSEAH